MATSAVEEASELEPESRGLVLELAGEAVDFVDCNKAIDYFLSAFEATTRMDAGDPSNLRAKTQRTIVERLAGLDLEAGLRLLPQVDRPSMTPDPAVDLRVHSTSSLVQFLLDRNAPGDIDKAAGLIDYVAKTGEYPYDALASLIQVFENTGQHWRSERAFRDAMEALARDQQFTDSVDTFANLIRFTQGSVPGDLRREAIHRVVASIRHQQNSELEEGINARQVNLICADKELHLRSDSSHFILNNLGLVNQIDPNFASELIRENPDIQAVLMGKDASATPESYCKEQGGIYFGAPDRQAVEEDHTWFASAHASFAVRDLASTQPDEAITQAEAIKLPRFQLDALVEVASVLEQSHSDKTVVVLGKIEKHAPETEDPYERIAALAGASEIWARLGNKEKASRLLDAGFDFTEKVLEEDPEASSYRVLQSPEAAAFERLGWAETRISTEHAAVRARGISDRRIRVMMLLTVARAALQAN